MTKALQSPRLFRQLKAKHWGEPHSVHVYPVIPVKYYFSFHPFALSRILAYPTGLPLAAKELVRIFPYIGPHLDWSSVFDALAGVKREEGKACMFFVLQLMLCGACIATLALHSSNARRISLSL